MNSQDLSVNTERNILMSMRISCEVIHRCFDQCITNLNSKRTTPEEEVCLNSCVHRLLKMNKRAGPIFMEADQKMKKAHMAQVEAASAKTADGAEQNVESKVNSADQSSGS